MPGLVVQHNLSAINANNKMNTNVIGLKKATEKLSSGYQINRAGDNAAGLAISEKMRSQIRGLAQATKNANDGISLIQTAEGGLNETHAILQRMRELAVQSANGTYTQEDRDAISLEADALKSEIDRISEATEYNTLKLLDGSLGYGGDSNDFGALYGLVIDTGGSGVGGGRITLTSNIIDSGIKFTTDASGKGGENAVWFEDGNYLIINLVKDENYSDEDIQKLIDNATMPKDSGLEYPPGKFTFKSEYGAIRGADDERLLGTVAGVRQRLGQSATAGTAGNLADLVADGSNGGIGSSDNIIFTANTYGDQASHWDTLLNKITIKTDVAAGKESVIVENKAQSGTQGADIVLHLSTGVHYSEKDIELILKKAGYDYSVTLTDGADPDGAADGTIYFNKAGEVALEEAADGTPGAGVGREFVYGSGKGLTFQIGANGVEDQRVTLNVDDMSADSLGVAGVDVSNQDKANIAIDKLDTAISKVSMQRAGLGALQNRLEYTVNNLTVTEENLTNAESQIRDTDMATEMINYTKFNILQQASQAMLAQANQQPQAVLQLLG
ncbi:MAG: flagellar hook protein [Oscillospiraceae bacterium]|nr:flagellar hook protein [Oscillospiraceae bacterium]